MVRLVVIARYHGVDINGVDVTAADIYAADITSEYLLAATHHLTTRSQILITYRNRQLCQNLHLDGRRALNRCSICLFALVASALRPHHLGDLPETLSQRKSILWLF